MANIQAVNALSGTTELPKYNATGITTEIWVATLTTALASGDTIFGPTLPAGCYLSNITTDWDDIDSGSGATFEAGYASHLAAFIATGNATPASGGIQSANVAGTVGFTATTDTQILVTMTGTAGTAVAGKMRIKLDYTASP